MEKLEFREKLVDFTESHPLCKCETGCAFLVLEVLLLQQYKEIQFSDYCFGSCSEPCTLQHNI